jgi:DNA modification methylase
MQIAGVGWDNNVPPVKIWEECLRILKPAGFCLAFCNPELMHRMAINIEDAGFRILTQISWLVTTKMAKQNRLKPAHELICVAQKPFNGSIDYNFKIYGVGKIDVETTRVPWDKKPPTGWKKGGHTRRSFGSDVEKSTNQEVETMDANPNGRYPSDVVGYFDDPEIQKYFYAPRATRQERNEYNDHPTPKPIRLMRYLARVYCPEEGIILDPFCGSGSTGIGAIQENRKFIGIDIDEHYCEIATKRLVDHCSSGKYENIFYDNVLLS